MWGRRPRRPATAGFCSNAAAAAAAAASEEGEQFDAAEVREAALRDEFKRVFKCWKKFRAELYQDGAWRKYFTEPGAPDEVAARSSNPDNLRILLFNSYRPSSQENDKYDFDPQDDLSFDHSGPPFTPRHGGTSPRPQPAPLLCRLRISPAHGSVTLTSLGMPTLTQPPRSTLCRRPGANRPRSEARYTAFGTRPRPRALGRAPPAPSPTKPLA
jgi:hypothetical protein